MRADKGQWSVFVNTIYPQATLYIDCTNTVLIMNELMPFHVKWKGTYVCKI